MSRFEVVFLPEVSMFIERLDDKTKEKIYYNIRKSQVVNDNELFKKLNEHIWEFRTLYNGIAYRLFAFWDVNKKSLVVVTHGILKKTQKNSEKMKFIRLKILEKNTSSLKIGRMDNKFKTTSLDEMIDKHIGKIGTEKRDHFENELRLDLLGSAIKEARKDRNLTQAQLGELVGVQKAQISKLENSVKNARFETIIKVFDALGAKVNFKVELNHEQLTFG